jgi:uncharacterized protein YcnI
MVALGPAAVADVNISPPQADQGGAVGVTFKVRNDRPGVWTKQVEVQFPEETPIGEIYPMSVADWAPVATNRELDEAVDGVHSSGLTTVTSSIKWTRSEDAPKAPEVEELSLQMGPLPKIDNLVFTVIQTYSDGKSQRWSGPTEAGPGTPAGPGTVLRLVPAAAGAPELAPAEEVATPAAAEEGSTLAQLGLIGAGIVGGVLISALAVVTIGSRNRAGQSADPAEQKEDVVA